MVGKNVSENKKIKIILHFESLSPRRTTWNKSW